MQLSVEFVVQILTVIVMGGGILWKLSEKFKHLELNQQAMTAQIDSSVRKLEGDMRENFAALNSQHAALSSRVNSHDEQHKIGRESISKVHQRVDAVQEKVIRLEAKVE